MTSDLNDIKQAQAELGIAIEEKMVPEMVAEDTPALNSMRAWSTISGIKGRGGRETLLTSLAPMSPSLEQESVDINGQPTSQGLVGLTSSPTSEQEQPTSSNPHLVVYRPGLGFLVDEDTCLEDPGPGGSSASSPCLVSPTDFFSTGFNHTTSSILPQSDTQHSLIQQSEQLQLNDPLGTVESSNTLWEDFIQEDEPGLSSSDLEHPDPEEDEGPCKALKASRRSDAPSSVQRDDPEDDAPFDADGASSVVSRENFVFTQFGMNVPCMLTFGSTPTSSTQTVTAASQKARLSTSVTVTNGSILGTSKSDTSLKMESTTLSNNKVTKNTQNLSKNLAVAPVVAEPVVTTSTMTDAPVVPTGRQARRMCSLTTIHQARAFGKEIRILKQPEEHHRARYMTEGSRGAVKDQSQKAFPVVKILGYSDPVTLQVFIGTDKGKILPHGFYQAIKVCGKNSTECSERDIDGTTVVELTVDPADDMEAVIDCVGILKLRNADVEQRVGVARVKKKSTRVRMVFRVCLPKPDGSTHFLQVASIPISCTQPAGQPEICRQSLTTCPASGGKDLFIIGKNFTKPTHVLVQQLGLPLRRGSGEDDHHYYQRTGGDKDEDSDEVEEKKSKMSSSGEAEITTTTVEDGDEAEELPVVWSAVVDVDSEYFQAGHLICTLPPYKDVNISEAVQVQIIVNSTGRLSDPQPLTYTPEVVNRISPVEQSRGSNNRPVPMETDEVRVGSKRPCSISQEEDHTHGLFETSRCEKPMPILSSLSSLPPASILPEQPFKEEKMQVEQILSAPVAGNDLQVMLQGFIGDVASASNCVVPNNLQHHNGSMTGSPQLRFGSGVASPDLDRGSIDSQQQSPIQHLNSPIQHPSPISIQQYSDPTTPMEQYSPRASVTQDFSPVAPILTRPVTSPTQVMMNPLANYRAEPPTQVQQVIQCDDGLGDAVQQADEKFSPQQLLTMSGGFQPVSRPVVPGADTRVGGGDAMNGATSIAGAQVLTNAQPMQVDALDINNTQGLTTHTLCINSKQQQQHLEATLQQAIAMAREQQQQQQQEDNKKVQEELATQQLIIHQRLEQEQDELARQQKILEQKQKILHLQKQKADTLNKQHAIYQKHHMLQMQQNEPAAIKSQQPAKATLIQGPAVQALLSSLLQGTNNAGATNTNTPILVLPSVPEQRMQPPAAGTLDMSQAQTAPAVSYIQLGSSTPTTSPQVLSILQAVHDSNQSRATPQVVTLNTGLVNVAKPVVDIGSVGQQELLGLLTKPSAGNNISIPSTQVPQPPQQPQQMPGMTALQPPQQMPGMAAGAAQMMPNVSAPPAPGNMTPQTVKINDAPLTPGVSANNLVWNDLLDLQPEEVDRLLNTEQLL